jgi:hypothetical protein
VPKTTADVRPIDEPFAGRILTRTTVILGNALCLVPVVFMFAGLGLAGGAAYLAFDEDLGKGGEPPLDPALAWMLIAVGVVVAVASGYWGLRNSTLIGNWYLRRLARGEVLSRPDAIVDPDDPDAIFVELVPRKNWKKLMLETATDVGYLLVDEARKEVLFEGDNKRMRIPAGAIRECEVEETVIGEGTGGDMRHFFVVLVVRLESGEKDYPFAYRGDMGQLGADVRERRADALCERILDLLP